MKITTNKSLKISNQFFANFFYYSYWYKNNPTTSILSPQKGDKTQNKNLLSLDTTLAQDLVTFLVPLVLVHPERLLVLHDTSQHGTTQEHHVLPARRILDPALELLEAALVALQHTVQVQLADVALDTRGKTRVHRRTTRQDNVLVELGTDIQLGLVDDLEEEIGDTPTVASSEEPGLEEGLGGLVTLGSDLDDPTIRKLVLLDKGGGLQSQLALDVQVETDVAQLLLDLTDGVEIGGPVEGISAEKEELNQVTGDVTTSNVQTLGQERESVTLVHRDDMSNTISGIDDNTGKETLGVQDQHGLDGDVGGHESVLLEHGLNHLIEGEGMSEGGNEKWGGTNHKKMSNKTIIEKKKNYHLPVLHGVLRGLSQHNLALIGVDLKLLIESIIPNMKHIIPVTNNTVVQGVGDLQHVPQTGSFVTNHNVLDLDVSNLLLETEDGTTDHARENGMGKVGVGETALHKPGSVIAN